MKNKIIVILVILLVIIGLLFCINTLNNKEITITKDNEYLIETDLRYKSLMNDGGSYTNEFYYINFDTNTIKKYMDKYKGFKGFEYKNKLIYSKKIDNNELKNIIENCLNEDINIHDIGYYSIKSKDKEVTSSNNKLKKMLGENDGE